MATEASQPVPPLAEDKSTHSHVEAHAVREEMTTSSPSEGDADDLSAWEVLKQNPAVIGYSICANFGPLLFGYDGLAISTIIGLPAFATDFAEPFGDSYIIPALWQGLWTAFNQLGVMLGALLNGFLQDRFGRRKMVFLGSFIVSGAVAMGYTSYMPESREARRVLMLMAKIFLGVGMGVLMSTCQTYVSEIAPAKIRGTLLGLYTFTLVIGQTIAISVVFSRVDIMDRSAYLVPIALQWMFAGFCIVGAIFMPESPSFLVFKGRIDDARQSFERLYGKTPRAATQLSKLIATVNHEREEELARGSDGIKFKELFQGTNLRRTRIVWLLNILQQFTGISLLSNAIYFLIMAGMNPSQSLEINQIGVSLGLPCILLSYYTMQKFGRRAIILASMGLIVLLFLGMGIAGIFPGNPIALKFIGVTLLLVGFVGNLGIIPAYQVVASEISSVRLRAMTLSSGFVMNALFGWLFSFVVPYMFNADEGNLGGKIGFVFVGFGVIGITLAWIEIPETRNKSYAQLDMLFERKTPTRSFKKALPEDLDIGTSKGDSIQE
ncbi:sugar transporter domain-containing protein [Sarocladium implicatum]|nr:sugar transporter domain-containing protein [Sarocladium implicatum]